MRITAFKRLLDSHPVVEYFFKRHNFVVHQEGLAQHYGLKTEILDLTSNLDIALFFAVCKYDTARDAYDYYREGEHKGILYVFDPIMDNEPCPGRMDRYMIGNIRPIGLQAFPRPGAQCGYGLRIPEGQSTKSWMYEFTFTSEDSKAYFDRFNNGDALWVKDRLVSKTGEFAQLEEFSFSVFDDTFEAARPSGWSKTRMKKALRGVRLATHVPDYTFSDVERQEIIDEWNEHLGREMASKILRKPWFIHDGKKKNEDGTEQVIGIRNKMDFQTMLHIGESVMPLFLGSPVDLEGAIWRNYTNKPCPKAHMPHDDGQWHKIEASMTTVFGKPYLLEDDWRI